MRYTVETDINLPADEVMTLLTDMNFMKEWHEGLVETRLLSETARDEGSMFKLYFKLEGRKPSEVIEVVLDLDNELRKYDLLFEDDKVKNHNINYLVDEGTHTRWVNKNEYEYKGIYKLFAPLQKGSQMRTRLYEMEMFANQAAIRMNHHQ